MRVRETKKKSTGLMRSCWHVFLAVIVTVIGFIGLGIWESFPTTSTFFYASTIGNLKRQGGHFGHFPDAIPKDARHVRFYWDAGGFHGDYALELRYELPEEQIEQLYQSYKAKGGVFVSWEAIQRGEQKIPLPIGTPVTEGTLDDFEFMEVDDVSGVAINRKSHEILFWAYST